MARWGAYETVREIAQTRMGAVWLAHAAGSVSHAADRYVIKTTESSFQLGDAQTEQAEVQAFVDAASEQKRLREAGVAKLVQVFEVGREGEAAYVALEHMPRSAQKFAAGKVKLDPRALRAIVGGVLDGLMQLREQGGGRAHGNLKAANVLLSGDATDHSVRAEQVFLDDIAPVKSLKPKDAVEDIRALGRIVHQLVTHRVMKEGPGFTATMSADWQVLGGDGVWWFDFSTRLMDAGVGKAAPTLDAVRDELSAYKPKAVGGGGKKWAAVAAAALVLLAGGAYVAFTASRGTGERQLSQKELDELPPWLQKAVSESADAVVTAMPVVTPESSLYELREQFTKLKATKGEPAAWVGEVEPKMRAWADRARELGTRLEQGGVPLGKRVTVLANELIVAVNWRKPVQTEQGKAESAAPDVDAAGVFRQVRLNLWPIVPKLEELDAALQAAQKESVAMGASLEKAAELKNDAVLTRRDDILRGLVGRLNEDAIGDDKAAASEKAIAAAADEVKNATTLLRDARTKYVEQTNEVLWRRKEFMAKPIHTAPVAEPTIATLRQWTDEAFKSADEPLAKQDDPRRGEEWAKGIAAQREALNGYLKNPQGKRRKEKQITESLAELARIETLVAETVAKPSGKSLKKQLEEDAATIASGLGEIGKNVASIKVAVEEGNRGEFDGAIKAIVGGGAIRDKWRQYLEQNKTRWTDPNYETLTEDLGAAEAWFKALEAQFPVTIAETDVPGATPEIAQQCAAAFAAEAAKRVGGVVAKIVPMAKVDDAGVTSAAAEFKSWRDGAILMMTAHVRAEQSLGEAWLAGDADSPFKAEVAKVLAGDGAAAVFAPGNAPKFMGEVKAKLVGVQGLRAQTVDGLVSAIGKSDAPVAMKWGAWRALAGKAQKKEWASKVDDADAVKQAAEKAAAAIATLPPARKTALDAQLKKDTAAVWATLVGAAENETQIATMLRSAAGFGVAEAEIDGVLASDQRAKFRVLVYRQLAGLESWPRGKGTEDQQKAKAAELVSVLQSAAQATGQTQAAGGLFGGLGLAAAGTPKFDPRNDAPLLTSIVKATAPGSEPADGGPVVYSFAGPRTRANYQLEFIPVEVPSQGEVQRAYVMTSEASIGLVRDILAAARAWDANVPGTTPCIVNGWGSSTPWKQSSGVWPWIMQSKDIVIRPAGPQRSPEFFGRVLANGWFVDTSFNAAVNDAAFPGVLAAGVGPVPAPTFDVPITQVTAADAALVAALIGCRVPTAMEWSAAKSRAGSTPANLRGAWFKTQHEFARAQRAGKDLAYPPPTAGIAYKDEGEAKGDDQQANPSASDDVIFFRATGNAGGGESGRFRDLIGNVAEWVFDEPARLDALGKRSGVAEIAAEAQQIVISADKKTARARVVGGSAFSPPREDSEAFVPWPSRINDIAFDKNFGAATPTKNGYSDVGFRLAFSAAGSSKSSADIAGEAIRVFLSAP